MVKQDIFNLKEFASYFNDLCLKKSINKAELSRLSGVSEATLSRIASADQRPSPDTLKKIAPHLGVSEHEIMVKAGYLKPYAQLNQGYFRVMEEAQEKGYSPEDVKLAIDFLDKARNRE